MRRAHVTPQRLPNDLSDARPGFLYAPRCIPIPAPRQLPPPVSLRLSSARYSSCFTGFTVTTCPRRETGARADEYLRRQILPSGGAACGCSSFSRLPGHTIVGIFESGMNRRNLVRCPFDRQTRLCIESGAYIKAGGGRSCLRQQLFFNRLQPPRLRFTCTQDGPRPPRRSPSPHLRYCLRSEIPHPYPFRTFCPSTRPRTVTLLVAVG